MGVLEAMPNPKIDARERLIAALDLPDVDAARAMVRSLDGVVSFYKIGLALQLATGTEGLIRELIDAGTKVFLDYKYYDVPETLRKAVARASRLGVAFLTIHGSGNLIQGAVAGRGDTAMKLFCVTVLTSLDAADIAEMGFFETTVEQLVLFRAQKALAAGCDGVIASGHEVKEIKRITGNRLLVVTPGIRDEDAAPDDQKRRTTARDAVLAGADYLVIGRPITDAPNPKAEAERYLRAMQTAFDELDSAG